MRTGVKLILSLLIPLVVGWSASWFTIPEIAGWYTTLAKPAWNPPNYIFGPVWTVLYVLMGIVLFLIWKNRPTEKRLLILFFIQLALNFGWSLLFFGAHRIGFALIDLLLLWIVLWILIIYLGKVHKTASWLLVPYIAWVSFAGILNYTIFHLNL